jgi:hypothetical protein
MVECVLRRCLIELIALTICMVQVVTMRFEMCDDSDSDSGENVLGSEGNWEGMISVE